MHNSFFIRHCVRGAFSLAVTFFAIFFLLTPTESDARHAEARRTDLSPPSPCVPGQNPRFLAFTKDAGSDVGAPPEGSAYEATVTDKAGNTTSETIDISVQSATGTVILPNGQVVPVSPPALNSTANQPGRHAGWFAMPGEEPGTKACDVSVTLRASVLNVCVGYSPVSQTLIQDLTYTGDESCDVFPSPTPSPFPSPSPSPGGVEVIERLLRLQSFLSSTSPGGIIERLMSGPPQKRLGILSSLLTALATALTVAGVAMTFAPRLRELPNFFAAIFGSRRRKERWWLVVDSDLGKPITGAIVQVFDAQYHKLRETQATSRDGQCGFLLPPGTYYVLVRKAGFQFPPTHEPPVTLQKNERFYLGGDFAIEEQDPEKLTHLIIPLDREEEVSASWVAARHATERLLAFVENLSVPVMIFGVTLNTIFVVKFPGKLNIAFEILYAVLFALKLYLYLTHKKGIGQVTDADTGAPVDLAAVRLYNAGTNRLIQTRVTNTDGRFFILVPRGTYTISVSKTGYETHLEQNFGVSGRGAKALGLAFQLRKKASGPATTPTSPTPPPGSPTKSTPPVSTTLQNAPPPPPSPP